MSHKRTLVTAALPYANGPVHIGHLAGCYLPADIFVRYQKLKGEDVLFICGSDEHGVPITIKARNEGITPQQVVDKYHALMRDAFAEFGIKFDHYSRTSAPLHHQTASDFFKTLYDKGVFIEEVTQQYYDEEVKKFLADRYIVGTCPRCGYENAYGDQCENCGSSLNATDLINPKSKLSGTPPVLRATKNWFLPLDKYQQQLIDWIGPHKEDWKSNVYGQCFSWLNQGLQPRAMTRDLDWGIKVPLPDTEGKVLYVWFDAPIGYISATKEYFELSGSGSGSGSSETTNWEDYWQSKDSRLIHFIGKDNIVFHCLIFPAMLMAHGDYILPENVPANEFLNLEGDKISTSRNWAVWLHEYLQDFPNKQDELRYVLTSITPETKDSDFSWKDYQSRVNNELVAIFGNFVNRTLVLTQKYFEGKVPQYATLHDIDNDVIKAIQYAKKAIGENIEHYKFRDALIDLMNLARVGNKYLADTEPWKVFKTDAERVATILYISLEVTAYLGALAEPFLPHASEQIFSMLNLNHLNWATELSGQVLKPNHQLGEAKLLFEKVEDGVIEKQIEKLQATKISGSGSGSGSSTPSTSLSMTLAETTIDDFQKMDLRVATILEAERVPKTDKLLKLKLDTGIDQRTVVSGIAAHYAPENIIGQQVVLLANLAPRKIKGIESKGMILMAEDENGALKFVTPSQAVANGSKIS
ncbi:MAG: methionine--tRNA ligase [Bacteroidia bacterium]